MHNIAFTKFLTVKIKMPLRSAYVSTVVFCHPK